MTDKTSYAQGLHFRPGVLLQVQMSHGMFTDAGVPLARDEEDFEVLGHLKFGSLYVDIVTSRGEVGCVLDSCVRSP